MTGVLLVKIPDKKSRSNNADPQMGNRIKNPKSVPARFLITAKGRNIRDKVNLYIFFREESEECPTYERFRAREMTITRKETTPTIRLPISKAEGSVTCPGAGGLILEVAAAMAKKEIAETIQTMPLNLAGLRNFLRLFFTEGFSAHPNS